MSIPCPLMHWPPKKPWYQQAWYWPPMPEYSISSTRRVNIVILYSSMAAANMMTHETFSHLRFLWNTITCPSNDRSMHLHYHGKKRRSHGLKISFKYPNWILENKVSCNWDRMTQIFFYAKCIWFRRPQIPPVLFRARCVNPLHTKYFRGSMKYIFTFHVIPPHWYDTGGWNTFSNKSMINGISFSNITWNIYRWQRHFLRIPWHSIELRWRPDFHWQICEIQMKFDRWLCMIFYH